MAAKHIVLYTGLALVAYYLYQQRMAQSGTVAVGSAANNNGTGETAGAPLAFNAGVANTSGNGMSAGAATNIGAVTGVAGPTIPTPVMRDSPSALQFFGGGAAAHPMDF